MENILREVLLDHVKSPKNLGKIESPSLTANSNNPVCGDVVKIDLIIEGGHITNVATSGQGCANSQASMSIFSEEINGKSTNEVKEMINEFKLLFENENLIKINNLSEQSKLLKFLGNNPSKIRCALLFLAVEDELKIFHSNLTV